MHHPDFTWQLARRRLIHLMLEDGDGPRRGPRTGAGDGWVSRAGTKAADLG
jgi:hypothetical protein